MHQRESAAASPSHCHLPQLYQGRCAPRWPGHPQRCPQRQGEEAPGQEEGPIRQWGPVRTAPSSPTGVICIINIFGTHHNPAVWPDPEVLPDPPFYPFQGSYRWKGFDREIRGLLSPPLPDTLICLSKAGCPGRPTQQACLPLAPRCMTPPASTQKTSRRGHLWLLFHSPQGPGKGGVCSMQGWSDGCRGEGSPHDSEKSWGRGSCRWP